jgi:hypothetical protein
VVESGPPVAGYDTSYANNEDANLDCQDLSVSNGDGDDTTVCTITNDDIAPKLTLVKSVTNDHGGDADPDDFALTIGGNAATSGQAYELDAGTAYAIDETQVTGYAFVSITGDAKCPAALGGTITLALTDDITCTITNDDIAPELTVIKHVITDNGGTAFASSFTMTVTATEPSDDSFAGSESPGTMITLDAGSYEVGETGPTGYTASFSADCSGTIGIGEKKTCTVTNDDQAATLIVIKHVDNTGGGSAQASDFTLDSGGAGDTPDDFAGAEAPGTTITLDAGAYNVTETGPTGYTATFSADCSGTIANGETKACTVTNTFNASDADGDGIPNSLDCSTLAENRVVDPAGLLSGSLPPNRRHATLQAAVNAAADNDVIGIYGNTTENVKIGWSTGSGGKDLLILGCNHRITASSSSKPVITIEASAGADDGNTGAGTADIQIDELWVTRGSIGFLVQTSATGSNHTVTALHTIRSDRNGPLTGLGLGTASNPGVGVRIVGDGNAIRFATLIGINAGDGIHVVGNDNVILKNQVGQKLAGNNGNGIRVVGNDNAVDANLVYGNLLNGIAVIGDGNEVIGNTAGDLLRGNLGDGINVRGAGTVVDENRAYANGGDGIDVSGGTSGQPNLITDNSAGARHKGNLGNGILVGVAGDAGNGTATPTEIAGNRTVANRLNGIRVASGGHQLADNVSGGLLFYPLGSDNGDYEFLVAPGNFNAGGNVSNLLPVPGGANSPFAPSVGTP